MIRYFQKIKGVGRYANYATSALLATQQPKEFKKMNLIYGENGSGKTTLTHIFRSLKGTDELLLKKITFNYSGSPEVQIATDLLNIPQYIYEQLQWQQHEPNIEIFDVHFINDHIYTGLEIQTTHKKKLFEIIVGERGIELKEAIQNNKIRIQKGNKIVRETAKALEQQIGATFKALDYANLEIDLDIDARIQLKKQALVTAKNHQTIRAKSALTVLSNIASPFEQASGQVILQQSLTLISTTYLEQFKAHTAHLNMEEKATEWLQQGFEAQYDDKCPFCLRTMDRDVVILEAYQQYFNTTYKQLIQDIEQINKALTNFNLASTLTQIDHQVTINQVLLEFWKTYLPQIPSLPDLTTQKTVLIATFEQVQKVFQTKAKQPAAALPIQELQDFFEALQNLNQQINEMNTALVAYNENITLVKEQEDMDVNELEQELASLLAIQKRSDPVIMEDCENLKKYTTAIIKLKEANKAKTQELNAYKGQIFTTYLSTINHHLQHFAPYLSIQKLTSGYMGSSTEPIVKFALCINGKEVKHIDKGEAPSMKYTLSEGDKNALALAFFFAKLETAPTLDQKIIVFDDPVASFDRTRLSKLLDQLLHFGAQAHQLFFLTHNYRLGLEFVKRVNNKGLSYSSNRLVVEGEISRITLFDG